MLNIDKKVWEETEVKEFGEYEKLELGGHPLVIKKVEIYNNDKKGTQSLKVQVDIASPDKQAGFFQKQFDSNPNLLKKWSNGATKYLSLKTESLSMLKGFITSVENSNAGFKFDMDETKLVGKNVGGVFGLEEYEKQDGTTGFATKLIRFRSIKNVDKEQAPNVKLLNGSYMSYDDFQEKQEEREEKRKTASAEEIFGSSIVETDTGELPFEI